MKKTDAYTQGYHSRKKGLTWGDNPYLNGTSAWVQWNHGRSDKSDKEFMKLVKYQKLLTNK